MLNFVNIDKLYIALRHTFDVNRPNDQQFFDTQVRFPILEVLSGNLPQVSLPAQRRPCYIFVAIQYLRLH